MFGKRHKDNGEKVFRYSIRKYHFGAASVAVAALMFFANGVQAQAPAVSPVTASDVVAGPSGNSDGDPQDSDEESPEKTAVVEQPVELKSAGESSAPEAKTEEGSREESEAEVKSPQPETKIDDKEETTQVAKEKDQEVSAPVADTSAAKSTQSTLEALLANLTLDSMKALHTEVEEALAKAKAVLENPKATQAQVDEQVKLMEDLTRRVKEALSPQVSTPPVLEKAGLTNTTLTAPEGTVLTPKEAAAKVLEKNPVASTNGEVRTPSTKLSQSEVSDNQNKEKLKTISKDLSAYLIQANEITRPETKKLLEGVEEIVKSIEASVSQPQLTPAEIEELLKKGKQAEKKLALALTREKSGKRDLRNGKLMRHGTDLRATPAALNTKRAYIVQNGDGSGLPAETYLYATRRSTIDKLYTPDKEVPVEEALKEAKITVKKDPTDENGYIWTVTFNTHNQGHQNALYWFTLPKGHIMDDVLGATRTTKGSSSYGGVKLNSEWRGKIKAHLSATEADYGNAKNHHFTDGFDSVTDVTDNNFIIGTLQRNQTDPEATQSSSSYYYLGPAFDKYRRQPIWNTAPSSDVKNKAKRNLEGLKENTDQLYYLKYDGSGIVTISYKTKTTNKYAPLYYAAGMRSYENSSGKQYFMARGLQEKPNAPVISDNNVGTVTVKPNTEKADKVEINYVGSDGNAQKATLTRNAQNGTWSSNNNGIEVSGTSFIVKPSAVKVGTQVKAKSWFGNSDPSDEATGNILRRTDKPTVTAKEDGSVIVRPSTNATHLTISYTDETSKQNKTITADKTGSSWGLQGDSAITIDRNSGEVTIPANSVADSTKVEAQAKAPGEALSEKAEDTARAQDRTAPTIQVRKNGTRTWLTADSKGNIIIPVAPESRRTLELDVLISDNQGGSGVPDFNSRPGGTVTKNITGTYKNNSDIYSSFGKASDATAKLSFTLNDENTASDAKTNVTVTLNAKDNAGNWTNATNKKEVTVKIVSAKPNYPSRVKVLNPTNIKDAEKDRILAAIKEANKTNEAHPTFTKGTDGIITTYTDGTTYTVPYSDVITYDYLAKKKTINVGENPNWGDPKQYFTYEDGGAIGNDKTFLWENSRNTTAPNNPDLTVGTNKRVEVLAPNPEGGALKTLTVTYDVVDGQPPKVKINGVELGENVDQNPRFAIYRGAKFNPTFEVSDNSGKTTYLRASGIPSGVWFNKQGGNDVEKTDLTNSNNQYTLTSNNIVDNNNTLGEHTASVTVKDASNNTKTYQFKYVILDIEARNTPETVPLNTKLVDPADEGHAKDSHNYVKVSDGNTQKTNGDDYYTTGMKFTWSKDNTPITNKTLLSTPGVVNYTAVVTFPNNGEKYSKTVDGKSITIYPPEKATVSVTFKVKPTAPTVRPENNGDVIVTPANETNVNKVEVTYTPADKNRLEDNGNVTKTAQDRTTVIATKGSNNQWSITSGAKEGISVNATTGEITLKDQVVKDQTKIQAKVIAQEVSSDENDTNNSKDGDRKIPTIDINNTLVEVGKEFSLPLGLSDGAGVGVDYTNIKVSSPNGETGLTYDATTKSIKGTINAATKKEITVRVLDKNGNKAEKTISIAAVKAKPIYAIKDGTIKNVDTPSNFVEMPAGLTASWKDDSRPTTAEAGNTTKTVTVSANGYAAINVDIPVTIYPKVTYRKVGGNEVTEYHEIVGQPLTSAVTGTGGRTTTVKPDFYVEFEGGKKPDGTTITFKDGNPASPSTTAGETTKTIVVTYPNEAGTIEKNVTFKTYGNEAKYEDGKDSVETIVGSAFAKTSASDYVKLSDPKLPNPPRTAIAWGDGYSGSANPVSKVQTTIGMREENVNVYYTSAIAGLRGDSSFRYTHQDIKVTLAVKPQAPTLTANQFQGKAGTKPVITVNNLPTAAQLTKGSTVTVQLKDATDTVVAEKTVTEGTGSTTFTEADYNKPVTLGQQLTANVVVSGNYQKTVKTDTGTRQDSTAYSLVSDNSNSEQVTPQKPTFDPATVTSTSRTLSGTLGGFNDPNRVVKVHLNDEKNTVLSSENNGGVTINNDGTWTATLPKNVKLRQSVAKNGETTMPPAITVENTVTGGTVSTRSDNKAVEMGDYSVASTVAGSKHIDITVPHDAKRVELRFHNNQETGDKPNSIVLVRGTDGWHTEATRADNTTVTDANGYVGTITSTPSTTNPAESIITIPLNEESNGKKLHIREEAANGDNTATYSKGLGLRVEYQPEAGQDPTAVGNWKVVNVTNTAPTIKVKGDTGKDATHRKVYDSGTRLTADLLKELVTVTDAEDSVTPDGNKPFGTGNVKIISQIPAANGTGTTPAGLYEVTLAAVDSQGKEGSQVKVYVAVKEATPSAPAVGQWQNGNVKVTPNSTNSGDKITIPLKSGSVVVTKDAQNGWQVTGQPNGVSVHDGSIEIPRNLVNTTVTATASKGEGDIKAVSDEGTHTLTAHEVTKADIIKKPTDHLTGTDLYSATGVTGVIENGVTKTYQKAGIKSVTSDGQLPELEADKEKQVPVVITYNDGSQEKTNVTLKVAPAAPKVTVNKQDGTTGDVTLTIKRHDDTNYPDGSVVTVPGIEETFKVKDGIITIKNDQLKDTVQTGKVIVKEGTKLPAETSDDKQ
ncbi:YSIRK-type signal peptide-containing protein, partial [Streptococcus sp. 20925_1_69]|uniref:YSIRK-type signal peptide-containing protein n=1 Tax=Streptococcus sp. 20925_1_69 TaxID=3003661 RepID=UPI00352CEA64